MVDTKVRCYTLQYTSWQTWVKQPQKLNLVYFFLLSGFISKHFPLYFFFILHWKYGSSERKIEEKTHMVCKWLTVEVKFQKWYPPNKLFCKVGIMHYNLEAYLSISIWGKIHYNRSKKNVHAQNVIFMTLRLPFSTTRLVDHNLVDFIHLQIASKAILMVSKRISSIMIQILPHRFVFIAFYSISYVHWPKWF